MPPDGTSAALSASPTALPSPADHRTGRNYDRAAWFYEAAAALFSGGKIRSSKKYTVACMNAGERVCFLGVGSGEEAILAAEKGCLVTCVDLSRGMLDRLERKLAARGLHAEIICGNALDHRRHDHYDAVAANYFLNIFLFPDMVRMLNHAAALVRPGGRFLVADVACPEGNLLARAFNRFYLKLGMIAFWMLGLVPLHRNYDYLPHLAAAGLSLDHVHSFRLANHGPVLFRTIVARRG